MTGRTADGRIGLRGPRTRCALLLDTRRGVADHTSCLLVLVALYFQCAAVLQLQVFS